MNVMIREYLKKNTQSKEVTIVHYTIDGGICMVEYYIDDHLHDNQKVNINIWNMLTFLYYKNELKK